MRIFDIDIEKPVELPATGGIEAVHRFDSNQVDAINMALGSGRPLLVRGEPGVGKSQLARASAEALGWRFVSRVVDNRTEPRDLLWRLDAVARLADAQIGTANDGGADDGATWLRDPRRPIGYVVPGVMWWALAWHDACDQARLTGTETPAQFAEVSEDAGCVVLIDEIDKGESDVPNGLLEVLGSGQFQPEGRARPVVAVETPPLVIITSNEERVLPDAFVRRCIVLNLGLGNELVEPRDWLIQVGRDHFQRDGSHSEARVLEDILTEAADLLMSERDTAEREGWRPLPGQAEYLDLIRAVLRHEESTAASLKRLRRSARYVLRKDPGAIR